MTDHKVRVTLRDAVEGTDLLHHHLQPDFIVASTNSSRSSNSYKGTGVVAPGTTWKSCLREDSTGKLSPKMLFLFTNSSNLMVWLQELRLSNSCRKVNAIVSNGKTTAYTPDSLNVPYRACLIKFTPTSTPNGWLHCTCSRACSTARNIACNIARNPRAQPTPTRNKLDESVSQLTHPLFGHR